jgi:phosphoglycerate kinase
MKTIDNLNFQNKRALIRVDFNVPLNDAFEVTDTTRITAAVPTIKKIIEMGGSIVLMSHLGRPKDASAGSATTANSKYSLKHITSTVSKLVGVPVDFADDCIGESAFQKSAQLKPGQILLLENLRFYKEEEKGDVAFAEKLSTHGDIYVNDAFGTAHRAHASTAVIAQFFKADAKCLGYVMANEVASINKVINGAEAPFTAIVGGAKVSDKILIIEQLMNKANNIIIGGGMAYTFIKAMGYNVGASLCELDKLDLALDLINKALDKKVNLFIPVDSVTGDKFSNDALVNTTEGYDIADGHLGLDIGPKTIVMFSHVISKSKTILWNGPMGVFEMSSFENGTKQIALAIAEATKNGAFSLIGGGDSVAAINKYNLASQVSYVSTGGGALLEYIENGTLPGVSAIE